MPIVSVTQPNDGEDADAADVNDQINAILAVLNGNIDADNLADGAVTASKIAAGAITSDKIGADIKTGWNDLVNTLGVVVTPGAVVNNGSRSYSITAAGTNLTSLLPRGARLKLPRSVAPPTMCTNLNGTNQLWRNTSPSGVTFTDDFSGAVWIKLNSYPAGGAAGIVSRYNGTSGFIWGIQQNGTVSAFGYNGSVNNHRGMYSQQSVPIGRWVKLSFQLDMSGFTTTTCKMQFDDNDTPVRLESTGTNPTSLVQAGNLEVGGFNGGSFFPGRIKELALFNALVAPDTLANYSGQTMVGNETNCIGLWKFSGNANDSSANGNNLTAIGSATADSVASPMNATEYGLVQNVTYSTDTTITVQVPEGYSLPTSGGLGTIQYSIAKSPIGFVSDPGKWEVIVYINDNSNVISSSTPSSWVTITGTDISVPIGAWKLGYRMITAGQVTGTPPQAYFIQISDSTPFTGDTTSRSQYAAYTQLSGSSYLVDHAEGEAYINLTSETLFKLYGISITASPIAIYMERGPAFITATNLYL